ncbi:FxSxx-COOH cyclophane-containing RiPP peptide [Kitasatospora sp. NPDC097643]|uniref:FxSxx-COOH cyclophane-containing RiPP peptide n=1 Tax=Kitasatospora sp. NPDC097643 TaxID=3157230 RepID=UPI003327CC77
MTPALDTMPTSELMEPQEVDRLSLADLALLGAEELSARLRRALPGTEAGAVPVAAFNSSI